VSLCSMMYCTAIFFESISVISFSMLWSLIIVGANTTAKFFGDICSRVRFMPLKVVGQRYIPSSPALC
jgi:hypothetical protein